MSDTLGGDFIYSVLSNNAGVTALTTAIYNARMVPQEVTATTTVNFYHLGPYDAAQEYFQVRWSADCRAETNNESLALAIAVRDAINRVTDAVGGYTYHGVVNIGGTIPPIDESDVFNTPVTLTVRRK